MKTADMLLQTEHISRRLNERRVVFIGDGDAIALCLVHLRNSKLLAHGPKSAHVLDFDERIVLSVRKFADRFGISDQVTSELYNVSDPLPEKYWQHFEGFYTNPPFGSHNEGRSVQAFLTRGIEAVGKDAIGCLVVADYPDYPWTQNVLLATERSVVQNGFVISEVLPEFHHYHLDDAPDLTSCGMVIRRLEYSPSAYNSKPLSDADLDNFYGDGKHLSVRYVRDLTNGGKLGSRDHVMEPLKGA